jgi:hypothetical protein
VRTCARALRLLRERSGVIVADEVGLGKTFIAGDIIRVYRSDRQRALLVCPAQLRDTTWSKFFIAMRLIAVSNASHTSRLPMTFNFVIRSDREQLRVICNRRSTTISLLSSMKRITIEIPIHRRVRQCCGDCYLRPDQRDVPQSPLPESSSLR